MQTLPTFTESGGHLSVPARTAVATTARVRTNSCLASGLHRSRLLFPLTQTIFPPVALASIPKGREQRRISGGRAVPARIATPRVDRSSSPAELPNTPTFPRALQPQRQRLAVRSGCRARQWRIGQMSDRAGEIRGPAPASDKYA